MTDADEIVGESESACDLGGPRKQGTDPHVLMISPSIAHLPPEPGKFLKIMDGSRVWVKREGAI
jgi:hypothetical protein